MSGGANENPMMRDEEKARLRIFQSDNGHPRNWYGGTNDWVQNWAAHQRATGKRPTWQTFIEAARTTGWPCVHVPCVSDHNAAVPVEFLEWGRFTRGGVYAVEILGRVKIGTALNFPLRFKQLQSHSPDKLIVQAIFTPAGFGTERALHRAFDPYRLNGEWFEFSPPIREFLAWAKLEYPDRSPPFWPDVEALARRATQFVAAFAQGAEHRRSGERTRPNSRVHQFRSGTVEGEGSP